MSELTKPYREHTEAVQEIFLAVFAPKLKTRKEELARMAELGNPVFTVDLPAKIIRIEKEGNEVFDLILKKLSTMTLPEMIADLEPYVERLTQIYGLGTHTIDANNVLIVEAIANDKLAIAYTTRRKRSATSLGFIFDNSILS